jgi:hypothetical protein
MIMTPKPATPTVKLDWSRLLCFDQAARDDDSSATTALNDPRLAKLGAKVGQKLGGRRPDLVDIKRPRA